MTSLRALLVAGLMSLGLGITEAKNVTYNNPILPGWNPDPSCAFVPEWNNTFFCTTSSFLAFPGLPVFASKDIINWKLASHGLTNPNYIPELYRNSGQNEGTWANTLRYHDGIFYLMTNYVSWYAGWGPHLLLFTSTDPYDDASWSAPIRFENPENEIDPDIFWDDDGKVYISVARGIFIHQVDISTGSVLETYHVWNGTGDRNPEGPNLFRKDGYYYLSIGEGGTESNHSAVIARSPNIEGPYLGNPNNPLLTAKNTDNFIQTVGHADFFQDASGNWWCVALGTRSGPEWESYPMGRETVLSPVRWDEGEWPVVDQISGTMEGPLPPTDKNIPGDGFWVDAGDKEDFEPGSSMPRQFLYWRPPKESLFAISPPGHPNTLRITPARVNLTGDAEFEPKVDGMGFVGRKHSASLFEFNVDVSFTPTQAGEEAGLSVFLSNYQHIDLSIALSPSCTDKKLVPKIRLSIEASGKPDYAVQRPRAVPIPSQWLNQPIRLSITTNKNREYVFAASPVGSPDDKVSLGTASMEIVSGGSGPFHDKFV